MIHYFNNNKMENIKVIENRKKLITRFLKENNIYQQYVYNSKNFFNKEINKQYLWSRNLKGFDDIIVYSILGKMSTEIKGGFDWECTKEGFDFWFNHSKKLENFIYENNIWLMFQLNKEL